MLTSLSGTCGLSSCWSSLPCCCGGAAGSVLIVEAKIFCQTKRETLGVAVVIQVDTLILHGSPDSRDEEIVQRPGKSVHADVHAFTLGSFSRSCAGKGEPGYL